MVEIAEQPRANTQETPILVYPNPVHYELNIKVPINQEAMVKVDLFDLTGRHIQAILERTINPSENIITIDPAVPQNTHGVYLLRIQIGERILTQSANPPLRLPVLSMRSMCLLCVLCVFYAFYVSSMRSMCLLCVFYVFYVFSMCSMVLRLA